jgi:general secretion pathway protein J
MERTGKTDRKPGGFTLIELLISFSIIGILILIISGSLRIGLASVQKGEEKFDQLERLRSFASIVDSQIQSWLPTIYEDERETQFAFTAERESLTFQTNYSIMDGRQGYISVTYRVEKSDDGKAALMASENLIGKEGGRKYVLLHGFDEIYFVYLFRDRDEDVSEWLENWTDYGHMPEAVLLIVREGGRVHPLLVPVRTVKTLKQPARPKRRFRQKR